MGRAKLPRKSTNIDMTAMCDVAFLLLSFFILATKFKPPEALSVVTPSSVSTKVEQEKNNFVRIPNAYIGAPFSQLKSYLDRTPEQLMKVVKPGIPAVDSTNNEMVDWFKAAADAFTGKKMDIVVKGDDASKYPALQGVIIALKKNDLMKFQVVTSPIPAPVGSELYNLQQKTGTKSSEQQ